MRAIELFRLRRVRDKPCATSEIATRADLTPDDALALLHAAVGGGRPVLRLPDDVAARECIVALAPLGFVGRFASAEDFDVPRRAQAAVLAVQGRLPAAISDAIGALLLAGDWELALNHGLQHLRMHASAGDAERALLERTAIEVGLVAGVPGRA